MDTNYLITISYNLQETKTSVTFTSITESAKNDIMSVWDKCKQNVAKGEALDVEEWSEFHGVTVYYRPNKSIFKMYFEESLPDGVRPKFSLERQDLVKWAKELQDCETF